MKNLESYGVQDLKLKEIFSVNGGQLGPGSNYIGGMGYAPPSEAVGHAFADFLEGVYAGLSSLWN